MGPSIVLHIIPRNSHGELVVVTVPGTLGYAQIGKTVAATRDSTRTSSNMF